MAKAAFRLSIFSFLPPFGVAAIVLGHAAERRIETSGGALNGKTLARAALWIAYVQLGLVAIAGVVLWNLLHETAEGFRRDAAVQRYLRETDQTRPLDPESAREAEHTAQMLMYQLIAIEDETRRYREDGLYTCNLNLLLAAGLKGSTDVENHALAARLEQSPYQYVISQCNPAGDTAPRPAYVLTAVPRTPRMPTDARVFCSDQTGALMQVRGGTSVDCLKHGEPAR